MYLYSKYAATETACCIGSVAAWLCVWLLCRLYCSNAIVSLNCYNAFVLKCGRRNAEVQVVTSKGFVTGLALAEEHTFHNVFRLPVNRSVPKNKVTLH